MYRDTYLQIKLKNLNHNIKYINTLNPNKKIMAVVKANAYGHGLEEISKHLEMNRQIHSYGVASLDEAVILRNEFIKKPILVLGAINFEQYEIAAKHDITITIYSYDILEKIKKIDFDVKVHVKIETGMNRLGISDYYEYVTLIKEIQKNKNIKLEGIYTHFSSADNDEEFTKNQIEVFKIFVDFIKDLNIEIHCQNSAGLLNFPNLDFVTLIRPGICIYGINPTNKIHDLKQLITLKSKVSYIKKVKEKTTVGYNNTFITTKEEIIGTFQLGYADGFKQIYNTLYAFKDSKQYPIIGKICMDQLMVLLDENIKNDEYFEFINEIQNIHEISKKTKISEYEILTSLSVRIERKYDII